MTTTTTKSYYLINEDGGRMDCVATDLARAKREAREWAEGGDYGDVEETIWADVRVYEVEDGYEDTCLAKVTVSIDPDEPECTEADHDWRTPYSVLGGVRENPGVRGHGGGVVSRCVCAHCGCYRTTDTWAQRRDTGEQGLTSVSYECADEVSLEWVERLAADD